MEYYNGTEYITNIILWIKGYKKSRIIMLKKSQVLGIWRNMYIVEYTKPMLENIFYNPDNRAYTGILNMSTLIHLFPFSTVKYLILKIHEN